LADPGAFAALVEQLRAAVGAAAGALAALLGPSPGILMAE
jgi:hypothetical protein